MNKHWRNAGLAVLIVPLLIWVWGSVQENGDIAARAGDITITHEELKRYKTFAETMYTLHGIHERQPDDREILDELILNKHVSLEAAAAGCVVSEEELLAAITALRSRVEERDEEALLKDPYGMALVQRQRDSGLSPETFWSSSEVREDVSATMLQVKWMEKLEAEGALGKELSFGEYKNRLLQDIKKKITYDLNP